VAFPSLAQVFLPRSFLCACPYTKDLRSSPRDLRVCRNEHGWAEHRGARCGVTGSWSRKDVQERASGAKSNQAQLQRLISVLDQVIMLLITPLDRLACSTRDPNPLSYPTRTLVALRHQFRSTDRGVAWRNRRKDRRGGCSPGLNRIPPRRHRRSILDQHRLQTGNSFDRERSTPS